MDYSNRLSRAGVVPVVVLEDASHAVPTAQALLAGGIDVMEITFRTAAAADSIRAVAQGCPDMLVGAGTVITLEQCKKAVECGAKFIVSPGFDPEVVTWCVENGITVTPGCVTPSEIMAAMKLGLRIVKFFPANVYGGLNALKSLSGPFGAIRFIPTGGVNSANINEFAAASFVHAVGGSWVCPKADISAGNYEKITSLCREARDRMIGLTTPDAALAAALSAKLGMTVACEGEAETLPTVRANTLVCALPVLEDCGMTVCEGTLTCKGDRPVSAVLVDEAGKEIRLIQK